MARGNGTSSSKTNMHYVLGFEETVYERRLIDINASLVFKSVDPVMQDDGAPANPSIKLVCRPVRSTRYCFAVHKNTGKMWGLNFVVVCRSGAAMGFCCMTHCRVIFFTAG